MRIKLSKFNPEKHDLRGWDGRYYSNRGTTIFSPSLKEDIEIRGNLMFMHGTTIEKLLEALKKNGNAKAHFAIDSGPRGGAGNAWYLLKNVSIDI